MQVELIDRMGSDLSVVNSARVSFNKESNWEEHQLLKEEGREWDTTWTVKFLSEKDQKLIKYLAKHGHFTPFTHVQITMRETVPIFVARQRFKHQVGFTYNEVSRRYVDDEPEFYYPNRWRKKAEDKKQGSSEEFIDFTIIDGIAWPIKADYDAFIVYCIEYYNMLIDAGVAPEQARMVLPQSMMTSYYVTGSLAAWARAYKLRSSPDAQKEIQELASQWNKIISNLPELRYSWTALTT